jgi:hypothetical protein
METLADYLPEDIASLLVTGVVALIAIWLVMFVVRKIIAVALVAAIIFAGWAVWHDPTLLQSARNSVLGYYDQWQHGGRGDESEPRPRW